MLYLVTIKIVLKDLLNIKPVIEDRANAITYQISTVSLVLSGHLVHNYKISYDNHLNLLLLSTAQQINLIDRLLIRYNYKNRKPIIHRIFIGQARIIAGFIPKLYEEGSLDFFSDKQIEYSQYDSITGDPSLYYPKRTLLWEFGEELARNANQRKNHKIIMQAIETYKYYYLENNDIIRFIRS